MNGMWACEECGAEWPSKLAAAICCDEIDRGRD